MENKTIYRSDTTKELFTAFSKFQGEVNAIGRGKDVEVTTLKGGKYTFAYAPMEVIVEEVKPTLAKNGLSVTQLLGDKSLTTILCHASGEFIGSETPIKFEPADPQKLGGLITYYRRYAYSAILGLVTEEDDDANDASGNTVSQTSQKAPKTNETPKVEQSTTSVVNEAKKPTEYTATLNQQRAVASAITHTVGIKDVVEQKKWISEFVKRPIVSLKELTAREASSVLDKYGRNAVAQVEQFKPKDEEVEAKKQEIEKAENGTELPF